MIRRGAPPFLLALVLGACVSEDVTAGVQCPRPEPGGSMLWGTGCPPCDVEAIQRDERGCPLYVSIESCSGDSVCVFGTEVSLVEPLEDDGGSDTDGGVDGADAH